MNFKFVLYFPILLLFLPAFAVYVPFLGTVVAFYLVLYFLLIFLLLKDWKQIYAKMANITTKTPFKYFLLFLILAVINSIFLSFTGVTDIKTTFIGVLRRIILCYLPIFTYFFYIIGKYISYKNFLKCFISLFWINLLIGFLAYFGQYFDLTVINNVFDFFANLRILKSDLGLAPIGSTNSNYMAFGLPRLDNLFEEPSFYSRFLFVYLPLVYTTASYKNIIFKNKYLNFIIKKTIMPFTWFSLILTQSPIYLLLFLFFTACYYYKKIFKFIKMHGIILMFVMIFIFSMPLVFSNIKFENTYVGRIISIVENIKSLDACILAEPSLGTRIVNFYNTLEIFKQHPLLGVGIGNVGAYQLNQLLYSKIVLTSENITRIQTAIINHESLSMNTALFYYFLASHGIIIFSVFAYFHIRLYKNLRIFEKYIKDEYLLMNVHWLQWSWITVTILMFYHIYLSMFEPLIIYVFIISIIYKIKTQNEKQWLLNKEDIR